MPVMLRQGRLDRPGLSKAVLFRRLEDLRVRRPLGLVPLDLAPVVRPKAGRTDAVFTQGGNRRVDGCARPPLPSISLQAQ